VEQLLVKEIALSFDRKKGRFLLCFDDQSFEQNVCEFLTTISFLVGKDVEEHLLNTDSSYDTVRIPLTGCGKVLTLGLLDFIRFREAYGNQMFLFKLEDLLLRKGVQLSKHL
jgi:hypothetical protein